MLKDKSIGIIPVFISRKGYKFLVIKQTLGDWIFPKGHRVFKETNKETALRELYEETNIDSCTIIKGFKYTIKYIVNKNGQKTDKKVIYFLGLVKNSDVSNKLSFKNSMGEVIDLRWLSYRDALKQLTHKNHREMLKDTFKYLKNLSSKLGIKIYEEKSTKR